MRAAAGALAAALLLLGGVAVGAGPDGDAPAGVPRVIRLENAGQPNQGGPGTGNLPPSPGVQEVERMVEDDPAGGEAELEAGDDNSGPGSDNSGPGSGTSGPGIDDSGSGSTSSGPGGGGSGDGGSGSSGSGSEDDSVSGGSG